MYRSSGGHFVYSCLGFPWEGGGGGGRGREEFFRNFSGGMCRWDTGTPSLYSWFSWILEIFWNKVWRAIETLNKYAIDMITGLYLKKMMRSWNAVSSHSIAINFRRYLRIILILEIMVKTTSLASLFHHVGHRNKSLCNSLFAFMFPFCNTCFQSTYLALFSLVRRPLNMIGK